MTKKQSMFILLTLFLTVFFGCSSSEGDENFEQLQEIEKGMSILQVHSIMTNDQISLEEAYWSDTLLIESYESGFGSSDYYKIIYSKKDSSVVEVFWGD